MLNQKGSRIVINGAGQLGVGLYLAFKNAGVKTTLTFRTTCTEKNATLNTEKQWLKDVLGQKFDCEGYSSDEQFEGFLKSYEPTFIIDTIPVPSTKMLNNILNVKNCFKVFFSTPAADSVKELPQLTLDGLSLAQYPVAKAVEQEIVNKHAHENRDALVIQIDFIPDVTVFEGKPLPSGLNYETMVLVNFKTGYYDSQLAPALLEFLSKWPVNKGFTCTPIKSVGSLLIDLIEGKTSVPEELFGQTVALHSERAYLREEMIKVLNDVNHENQSKPVDVSASAARYKKYFSKHGITDTDVTDAIRLSNDLFHGPNLKLLIDEAMSFAKLK